MENFSGKARIAVDAVIFTVDKGELKILLHSREKTPFKGKKELPGGLLRGDETAEQTLQRKLQEYVGAKRIFFQQFHTFTDISRDPRERTISIAFIALVNSKQVGENFWCPCENVDLAFDHTEIVLKARSYLKEQVNTLIVKQFMPDSFPLNQLQEVYELIEGRKYDNRNFRKKMISSGIVTETKILEKGVSHRPAKLFRFL